MPDRKSVLITGAAGLIGGLLRDGLKDSYNVTGVDIRPVDGFTSLVADTSDLDAVLPAYVRCGHDYRPRQRAGPGQPLGRRL